MKIISHRGNLNGPDKSIENNPQQVDAMINLGFDVEIDLHFYKNDYYLGHDEPQYLVDKYWLLNKKDNLWVHLKTLELATFPVIQQLNYFWHENDKMTLTNKGIPWCYPEIYIDTGVTVVLTDKVISENVYGVCTDYPQKYKGL